MDAKLAIAVAIAVLQYGPQIIVRLAPLFADEDGNEVDDVTPEMIREQLIDKDPADYFVKSEE